MDRRTTLLAGIAGIVGIAAHDVEAALARPTRRRIRTRKIVAASHGGCVTTDEGSYTNICCTHDDPTQSPPTVTDCIQVFGPLGVGPQAYAFTMTRNGDEVPIEGFAFFPTDNSCALAEFLSAQGVCAS